MPKLIGRKSSCSCTLRPERCGGWITYNNILKIWSGIQLIKDIQDKKDSDEKRKANNGIRDDLRVSCKLISGQSGILTQSVHSELTSNNSSTHDARAPPEWKKKMCCLKVELADANSQKIILEDENYKWTKASLYLIKYNKINQCLRFGLHKLREGN